MGAVKPRNQMVQYIFSTINGADSDLYSSFISLLPCCGKVYTDPGCMATLCCTQAAVDRFWKKQWSPALKKQCQDFVGVKGELRNITVKRLTVAALGQNSRIKPEDWEDPAFLTAVSPFGDATKYVTQEHLRKDAHAFGVDLRGRRTTSEILEALLQHTIQMARTGRGSEHRAASLDLPGMEELRREIFSYVVFDCEKPLADILSLPRLVQEAKLLLQCVSLCLPGSK